METIKNDSLAELFNQLRQAKIARGHAERKKGVSLKEIENLDRKIRIYEWLIDCIIKEL